MIQEFPMDKCRMAHRIAVFGASTIFAVSAAAHHGPIAEPLYDTSEVVEFEGEVTDVFWRNPHARIRVRITAGPQTGESTVPAEIPKCFAALPIDRPYDVVMRICAEQVLLFRIPGNNHVPHW